MQIRIIVFDFRMISLPRIALEVPYVGLIRYTTVSRYTVLAAIRINPTSCRGGTPMGPHQFSWTFSLNLEKRPAKRLLGRPVVRQGLCHG
jgi:hypothetical protein